MTFSELCELIKEGKQPQKIYTRGINWEWSDEWCDYCSAYEYKSGTLTEVTLLKDLAKCEIIPAKVDEEQAELIRAFAKCWDLEADNKLTLWSYENYDRIAVEDFSHINFTVSKDHFSNIFKKTYDSVKVGAFFK